MSPEIARITYTNQPVNLIVGECDARLAAIVEKLVEDAELQVLLFESGTPYFFLNHFDLALEVILSSADYDAATAEKWGWVTSAVPDAKLDGYIDGIVRRLACSTARRSLQRRRWSIGRPCRPTPTSCRPTESSCTR